eukprot:SAG31_NODE_538_length_14312_cov_12.542461_16_plen_84_part_00
MIVGFNAGLHAYTSWHHTVVYAQTRGVRKLRHANAIDLRHLVFLVYLTGLLLRRWLLFLLTTMNTVVESVPNLAVNEAYRRSL